MKIKAHVQKWYTMYPERQSIRGNQNRKVTYSACLLFGNDKITNYHRKGIFHMNRDSELPFKMNVFWGWGHSSVAQHLPSKCEVMSPIPNQTKTRQNSTLSRAFSAHLPRLWKLWQGVLPPVPSVPLRGCTRDRCHHARPEVA